MEATLGWLGLTLAVLSAGVWVAAAVAGRWLCLRRPGAGEPDGQGRDRDDGGRPGPAAAGTRHRRRARRAGARLQRPARPAARGVRPAARGATTGSNGSPATPRTSSARRWRPCSARSRSRSAATARRRNTAGSWSGSTSEGVRLRQIVESLLLLAQPEGGRPEPAVVDLADWVPDHLRRWSTHPRAADLGPRSSTTRPLCVRVHPPLLAQLVDNLLENACKYRFRWLATRVIDRPDAFATPGLIDAHGHMESLGASEGQARPARSRLGR